MVGVGAGADAQPWTQRWAIERRALLVVGAVLAADAVVQAIQCTQAPVDYRTFYVAARALAAGSPLYGGAVGFLNPPLAALVLVPLARLPLHASAAIFLALSMLAMGIGIWLLIARLHCPPWVSVLAALSLPAAGTLGKGQWDGLLFLALVGALVLLERRPALAGLLLSVLVIKVQAVLLVPVVLIALGRWRTLLGMGVGAVIFAGSTVAILGAHWMDWPRAVLQIGSAQETWSIGLPSVPAYVWGSGAGLLASATAGVAAVIGIFVVRRRLRDDPALAVAAAVCLSLLLGPHSIFYDLLLVAPALALAGRRLPLVSAAAAAALSLAGLVGALPSVLGGLDAYVPAFALAGAAVIAALILRPSRDDAGPAAGPAAVI